MLNKLSYENGIFFAALKNKGVLGYKISMYRINVFLVNGFSV
jgi:hypothetical protein